MKNKFKDFNAEAAFLYLKDNNPLSHKDVDILESILLRDIYISYFYLINLLIYSSTLRGISMSVDIPPFVSYIY